MIRFFYTKYQSKIMKSRSDISRKISFKAQININIKFQKWHHNISVFVINIFLDDVYTSQNISKLNIQ